MGTSFGRGAATLAVWDVANADCVLIMGSNMAENHPIAFRFVLQAKERGARIIHADPRFTRTTALADLHAPLRSGSDIAFLGGVIRWLLEEDRWFRDYVLNYTNISHIIEGDYGDPEQNEGLFSGYDAASETYADASWQYEGKTVSASLNERGAGKIDGDNEDYQSMARGPAPRDPTLQHPNCVYQIMKRHYARYTPEMVEQVCGTPHETFLELCRALADNSGRERTATICYAVGWTHHTTGVQIIRAASIVQMLLGNMGRPGGGILALRGHASIQGSTDIPTLYNMLPTYLPQPNAFKQHTTFADYLKSETPATGWWNNFPKYAVSLLKAWYGEHATAENEWGYQFLPKMTGDVSQQVMTLAMADGLMRGWFMMGQNPLVGAVNAELVEKGLGRLEFLVVRDMAMMETANFWQKGRLVARGEVKPEDIATEVFFFPTSLPGEKDGSVTNTNRLVQWHDTVLEAPGDSRSDLWFVYHLGKRLRALYADSDKLRDRAIQALTWDYPERGKTHEPDAEAVLREINGYTVADRKQVATFMDLKDDGSTACGGWMYCGIYPADGVNLARSRKPDIGPSKTNHSGWAYAWPLNRRTLYNRASADVDGNPWSEHKKLIWWDEAEKKWTGHDVPDFIATKAPSYRPDFSTQPQGMDAHGGDDPFIMLADGKGMLFVPTGLADGPLPTHYEPIESPTKNALYKRQDSPTAYRWTRPGNELHEMGDPDYPYVFSTFRLTELHCGGVMSRVQPHTAELQPEAFVEVPPELAGQLGIHNRDWTVLTTKRGEVEVRALVTERMRPFMINGKTTYQIGMPWVFGREGYASGAIANVLLAMTGDANTSIHSTKAITCNLRRGRLRAVAHAD